MRITTYGVILKSIGFNTNNNKNRISLTEPDIADIITQLNQFYQKGIRDGIRLWTIWISVQKYGQIGKCREIIDLLCQTTND